jgi:hypothetical protein
MRWEAAQLARFARGAGFVGDDVTEATALALAVSGGIASFDHTVGAPGAGHYVGLWGIDVDRYPEYALHDLHVPQTNAAVAHELWEAAGGWSWSPTHAAGYHLAHRKHAGIERTRELHAQHAAVPVGFGAGAQRLRAAHAMFAQARDLCRDADLGRF